MATNVDGLVQEGIAAIKAGRKEDARRVLTKAVDLDERNEQAWLWLSAVVETAEEQQICLENVLAINPSNEKARKGLDALAKQPGQKAAAAPPPPAPDPYGSPYDNNPFEGTGFDSNPYGSSVDWGRGETAAHGSGKQVQLPSSAEYDNWVDGLNLSNTPAPADATYDPLSGPFASSSFGDSFDNKVDHKATDDSDPFGASAFDSGPFGKGFEEPATFSTPAPSAESSPFADFGGGSSANKPFAAPAPEPPSKARNDSLGKATFSSPPASMRAASRPASRAASNADDPLADLFMDTPKPAAKEDPLADLFMDTPKPAKPRRRDTFGGKVNVFGGSAGSFDDDSGGVAVFDSSPSASLNPYYRSIPPEIEAGGGRADVRLILSVGLLAVLNAVALAFMVLNLMRR